MPGTILFQLLALHFLLTVPHELGHFAVARLVGVSVPEFGIGLPPTLVARRWRGTRWSVNLLPIGAFIGYNAAEASPSLRRIAIAAAGPAANFLVALICLAIVLAARSGSLLGLAGQVILHLTNGLAHPWGGDEFVTLGGLGASELVRDLSHWGGVTRFLSIVLTGSLVVGLFNLLPFPPLDGGKLVQVAMRLVRSNRAIKRQLTRAGLAGLGVIAVSWIVIAVGVTS